jgi:hypothetical protein
VLERVDDVGMGAPPLTDTEADARAAEPDDEQQQLAPRVEVHGRRSHAAAGSG